MFEVILHEPEIPPNTGNIIRLCANSGCRLHLIEPLGFTLDDARLRRAGLDYQEYAGVLVHPDLITCLTSLDTQTSLQTSLDTHASLEVALDTQKMSNPQKVALDTQKMTSLDTQTSLQTSLDTHASLEVALDTKKMSSPQNRLNLETHQSRARNANRNLDDRGSQNLGVQSSRRVFAFSTRGTRRHDQISWRAGDVMLFGAETRGLPEEVLAGVAEDQRVRLPMRPHNRSLNLSNAVAVAVFEAWRQHDFSGGC